MVGLWVVLVAGATLSDVSLSWSAPNVCPASKAIEREASYLVGRTVRFGQPARLSVRVSIAAEWVADVELKSSHGARQRRLSASSCAELANAVALIISLAIEQQEMATASGRKSDRAGVGDVLVNNGVARIESAKSGERAKTNEPIIAVAVPAPISVEERSLPVAEEPTTVAVEEPARELPAGAAQERRVVTQVLPESGVEAELEDPLLRGALRRENNYGLDTFSLAAGAFGDVGTLPSASLGFSAMVSWRPLEYLSFGTGASILLSQRAIVRSLPEAGGAMSFHAGRGRACFHAPALADLELAACGGAELAFLGARGFGATTTREAMSRWTAPFGTLTATYPLGDHIALTLHAEGLFPTVRPIFVLDGIGEVHRTPAILGRAGLAAEVLFP